MAVEATADLVTQVASEWGLDPGDSGVTVLGWLNNKHRQMVARSKCYRKTVALGTTDGSDVIAIPSTVLEVYGVRVDGAPWERVPARDFDLVVSEVAGWQLVGEGGVFKTSSSAAGASQIELYPVPESGLAVDGLCSVRAPELVSGGQAPVVPAEFFEALVAGAASIGLKRMESRTGEANDLGQQFDAACEELRRQTRRQLERARRQIPVRWP